ncbi:hypothetical protein N9N28_00380 [Rubripirellula amarantea]|nr:hypothetical protein [Rubripirellula amarantea]
MSANSTTWAGAAYRGLVHFFMRTLARPLPSILESDDGTNRLVRTRTLE